MAQEAVVRHVPLNPCCELLQKKESKLSQKLAKSEEGRNFLKKAIRILQDKITNFEAENVKLKKELELASMKPKDDGEKKIEESACRDTLENEISVLRSEISCLKQKGCSGSEDVDEKVAGLQARVSEGEKEISILKEHLEKDRMRAENDKKMAEKELKMANEALQSAKADMARAEKLQADKEREMKMNESTIRVSLENEISSLKSQIAVLQQQTVSGTQDANKEVTLLQESVSEQKAEINRLKELIQIEKKRADSEKKKAEELRKKANDEKRRAEKVLSESKTELRVEESAVRVSLEDEISSLKSQITLLQQQAVLGAQDVNKDIILLQDCISNKEKEIKRLHELLQIEKHSSDSERNKAEEERKKADEKKVWAEKLIAENEKEMKLKESAVRLPLENEISSLKSQLELLQKQVVSGAQDVSKNSGAQDVNEETVVLERRISDRETEINRLKKLLQKEKKRADSEKKKAETEKCRAEKVLADSERDLKEKEQAVRLSLGIEISALESQIHLLQQEIAVRDEKKEVNLYQSLVSKKEAEINQLKKLVEKERTRAESEKKKAEAGKMKVNESQKIAKTEKARADEEKRLADIERKNVEESRLQLEILRAEVHDLRANLESESLKVLQANENLETEKQRVIKERQRADTEMAKAGEQSKLLETTRREILEERARADCLSLQLEEDRGRLTKLQKEIGDQVSSQNTGKDAGDLSVDITSMKLLRKTLKLERMQAKHAKQVASFEKDRNILLQQEIRRIKEAFSGMVDHLDILDKCSSHRDVGINDLEKNSNVSRRRGLKRKFSDEKLCQVHHSGNELMKSSSPLDAYDTYKHRKQCSAPLLSSKDCTEPLSGVGSELVPLLGGTKQALLKTSATNSTMASFSDKALLGSQEGWALSVDGSDKLAEGATNMQLTVPGPSNNISKPIYNKKFVPVAENSVRCPLRINDVGHEVGLDKNRNRSPNAVESSEYMYHVGKKRCRQITENVSVQQDMLECSIEKQLGGTGGVLSNINYANQERKNAVSVEEIATQHLTMSDELKTYSHPTDSRPMFDATGTTPACNEETGDASRNYLCSFDEVEDGDYLKLLSLDNPFDEESYRMARERPLSPTLPEIGSLCVGAHEKDNNDLNAVSPHNDNMVPFCRTDEEIASSKINAYTSRTCHVPLSPEKVGVTGLYEILENNDTCHTSDPSNLGQSFCGHKGLSVTSGSNPQSACSPRYYVIFSDITNNNSISKISSATRTCMAQCSMLPQTDHVVQVMSTLLKVEGLLSREMVCVFFSLLLQSVPEFALENFKNLTDGGLVRSFEIFTQQVHSVMDDLETKSIEELLNLDELLSLIEDFLIHRRVLLHCDVLSESLPVNDPKSDIDMSGGNMLSFQVASDQQLISASVVLASICLAVDHIGFVCETSYNMLKMRRIDSSTLAILHVFAYISGDKYFTNCDHSLSMTVMKSLVTVLEREMSSTSAVQFGFPPCKNCPYSVSAIPMDDVVSLLIKKLRNYVLSNVSYEDLREATVYLNAEAPISNENREPSSGDGENSCVQCDKSDVPCCSHKTRMSTSCRTLFYLGDVMSLLELVASNMNWSWSFTNIVRKLLEILDSCGIEKLVPAIVVLLGQLGRLGVDANGYDDTGVETLRGRLSSFLQLKASAVTGLPFQIATVTALLGLVPLRFEELFKSNNEISEVVKDSGPADCIRNWFSLLSKEHQSLSIRLLLDNVASLRMDSTLLQV